MLETEELKTACKEFAPRFWGYLIKHGYSCFDNTKMSSYSDFIQFADYPPELEEKFDELYHNSNKHELILRKFDDTFIIYMTDSFYAKRLHRRNTLDELIHHLDEAGDFYQTMPAALSAAEIKAAAISYIEDTIFNEVSKLYEKIRNKL